MNGRNERTDHVAKENISRVTTHIRSILELDFRIPEAKTGTAYKLQEVAKVNHALEVQDKFSQLNADIIMFVSHWNIFPEISPIESNNCFTNSIQCAIRFCNVKTKLKLFVIAHKLFQTFQRIN